MPHLTRRANRAVTLPLLTAGLLAMTVPTAPAASAATSATCPQAASTRLLTATVLGEPITYTQLWLYAASATQTVVCFALPNHFGSGAIVVDHSASVTPPTILAHTNPDSCPFEVVNLIDPAPVKIAYGRVSTSVCVTVDGDTKAVTIEPVVGTDLPSVEIWRDGTGATLDHAACTYPYAQGRAGVPGAAAEFQACLYRNERLV